MSRFGVIALSLLTLGVPAAGVCGAMGELMDACVMAMPHDMETCGVQVAPLMSCCGPTFATADPEVVLKRPSEIRAQGPAVQVRGHEAAGLGIRRGAPPDPVPPPRPAPYRLGAALLL